MAIQPALLVIRQINLHLFDLGLHWKILVHHIGVLLVVVVIASLLGVLIQKVIMVFNMDLLRLLPLCSCLLARCPLVNKNFLTNNPKWLIQIYILIQIIR
jgi:hypothetical protein